MEHHSNIVPWQRLAGEYGFRLLFIPVTTQGDLDMNEYKRLISNEKQIRLLSVVHVSNAVGTVNNAAELISIAHENNIPVALDASQSIQHMKIDVRDLDCDFMAFSGHKIYGPTGTGILYGKQTFLEEMEPYKYGGEMIDSVNLSESSYKTAPYKYEAGTPNYIGATGLKAALDFISGIGIDNIRKHEQKLMKKAESHLSEIPGLRLIGNPSRRCGVLSFTISGVSDYDLGALLDKHGVAVRVGAHCAQPLLNKFNIDTTTRISFGLYNTSEDINILIEALNRSIKLLRNVR